jgi:hypothetical protein
MRRSFILFAICLFSAAAHAGECPKLKAGDSFKELSAVLECQELRIKSLEDGQTRGGALRGETPSSSSESVWAPGKCFPYEQNQPFKVSITVEDSQEETVLCWRDGIAIAKIGKIKDKLVVISDTAGYLAENSIPYQGCPYNKTCTLKLDKGKVSFVAQMLMVPGESRRARLTIESRPF